MLEVDTKSPKKGLWVVVCFAVAVSTVLSAPVFATHDSMITEDMGNVGVELPKCV